MEFSIVFFSLSDHFQNDLFHLVPVFFHSLNQLHLGAEADQIVFGVSGLEVHVALQIVGQEAHTALNGHHLCAFGEKRDLACGI